jgi:Holliday junction resolvasome RuvABC endonuclease subunit
MLQIGFDAGSNVFGLAAIDERNKQVRLTTLERPYPKSSRFLKEAHGAPLAKDVTAKIREWMKELGDSEITLNVEEYYPGRGSAQWVVPWLQAYVVGYFIRDMETTKSLKQLNYVMPSVWKKNLIGKHTNGKEMVMETVAMQCHLRKWKIKTDSTEQDQYDAFGIANYGLLLAKGEALEKNRVKHHSVQDGALF